MLTLTTDQAPTTLPTLSLFRLTARLLLTRLQSIPWLQSDAIYSFIYSYNRDDHYSAGVFLDEANPILIAIVFGPIDEDRVGSEKRSS